MSCLRCLLPISEGSTCYGMHEKCYATWFRVPSTAIFTSLTRRSGPSTSDDISKIDAAPQNNSFFLGRFKKYSALLNGRSFILKMGQSEAPELPSVEYLCNQIGKELGIPVADFFIINFEGELVFVTENFIKKSITPTDLQHIHHFRSTEDHNCRGLVSTITKQTGRPYDVKVLIMTILFDALIGNHDRHGRNLGFIITANERSLSPIYDNVSYLSLESGDMLKADFNPLGKIATESSEDPTMLDYITEFINMGFYKEITEFYQRIKLEKIEYLIQKSFCSSLMKQALRSLIFKRYTELKNEI